MRSVKPDDKRLLQHCIVCKRELNRNCHGSPKLRRSIYCVTCCHNCSMIYTRISTYIKAQYNYNPRKKRKS
jgi:hypothetical protein